MLEVGLKNSYKCVHKHINCEAVDLTVVDYIFFIYVMTSITEKIRIYINTVTALVNRMSLE